MLGQSPSRPDIGAVGGLYPVELGRGFFGAGGVAAGKPFAIRVVGKAFEDGGQGPPHLLQLDGVFGYAREVFLFTGIASELKELVGVEGILVGVTGARSFPGGRLSIFISPSLAVHAPGHCSGEGQADRGGERELKHGKILAHPRRRLALFHTRLNPHGRWLSSHH